MKKLLASIGVLGFLLLTMSTTFAFDFSFGYQRNGTEAVKSLKDISIGGVEEDQKDNMLDVIKSIVNWVLGILALIALLMVMYGGFQMVTSAGDDEKYNKGRSFMKSAIIGLVIIGIAWFVISIIIRLSQQVGRATEGSGANTDQ